MTYTDFYHLNHWKKEKFTPSLELCVSPICASFPKLWFWCMRGSSSACRCRKNRGRDVKGWCFVIAKRISFLKKCLFETHYIVDSNVCKSSTTTRGKKTRCKMVWKGMKLFCWSLHCLFWNEVSEFWSECRRLLHIHGQSLWVCQVLLSCADEECHTR